LFIWLRESEDVRTRQFEALRRDLEFGLQQADQGEVAPLDISSIRAKREISIFTAESRRP
jgi:hypothetical protein